MKRLLLVLILPISALFIVGCETVDSTTCISGDITCGDTSDSSDTGSDPACAPDNFLCND